MKGETKLTLCPTVYADGYVQMQNLPLSDEDRYIDCSYEDCSVLIEDITKLWCK